jgi:antitoxin component of RelBE/YafQ-DinJ toxin-antitoxin module
MTTMTFKINERTKAGKAFLTMKDTFFTDAVGVEIVETPNFETVKAMYEAENKIGLTKSKNTKDLLKKLRS